MREYQKQSVNISLSKTIFSTRSGTPDLKAWNSWNYENILFVMSKLWEEIFQHFMTCSSYGNIPLQIWKTKLFLSKDNKRRQLLREKKTQNRTACLQSWLSCSRLLLSFSGPLLPVVCYCMRKYINLD